MFHASEKTNHLLLNLLCGLVVTLAAVILGCKASSDLERVDVSGSVTFQGKPVRDGQIRFVPLGGTRAPVSIEVIRDGQYSTETTSGVPVGNFRVEIRAYNPNEPAPSGPGTPPRKQLLPAKYNVQSTLELKVAPGEKSIRQDYELIH